MSVRYFLTRLQVEGFRGINNDASPLDLRFKSDAVNSVFAANALGKSSIFDALSYAIRGGIPKLDKLHAVERPSDYYCNKFHSTGTATISLTFAADDGSGDITVNVQRKPDGTRSVTSSPTLPDAEAFLRQLNEDFALLDYSTFSGFIDNSPLDRGRSFSSLLGLSKLSEVRQVLKTLSNAGNIDTDFQVSILTSQHQEAMQAENAAMRKIRAAHQSLLGTPLTEPMHASAVVAEATRALTAIPLIALFFADKDVLTADFKAVHEAIRKADNSEARETLATSIRAIATLEALAPTDEEVADEAALLETIRLRDAALAATRGPLTKTMLESVKYVLDSKEWDKPTDCPACESTPSKEPRAIVQDRLRQYEAVTETQTALVTAWQNARGPGRLNSLEACREMNIPSESRRFAAFDSLFRRGSPSNADVAGFRDAVANAELARIARLGEFAAQRDTLRKELPESLVTLTQQVQHAEILREGLTEHGNAVALEKTLDIRLKTRQRWKTFVEFASLTFQMADAEFAQKRTTALRPDYQDMYARLVGKEIVPTLEASATTEDLNLRLEKFFDLKNMSATTLLSESHRNAVALSIFLSAALRNKAAPRFIVLDDVTSSFDAGHQFHLMELLRQKIGLPENPDGLQVIVLSHDGLLEKYFDKLSNSEHWHHQRLQGWPPTGCVLSHTQDANRLRSDAENFLRAGQLKQAEPLIRQYLEFKLLQVISKVRIPVPLDFAIRDHLHMVTNCLDAINAAIDLHAKASILILDATQQAAVRNTHVPALLSNWVSHYETASGASISPHVLLALLQTIDDFVACFCYACSCDGPTKSRYYRSLKEKNCKC